MKCKNRDLCGLIVGIVLVFVGFGFTFCSIKIDGEGGEMLDKFGVLILVLGGISASGFLSKLNNFRE